jgi:hypothetical protein
MSSIVDHISGELCFLLLGSIGDRPRRLPASLQPHIRGFFLDAVNARIDDSRMQAVQIEGIVAAQEGQVTLTQRRWIPGSSVPPMLEPVVAAFGIEEYVIPVKQITAPAITLSGLAERYGVSFDFIKTDIEGLDGPVIQSAGALLDRCLVATMELRFLPNYEGEPHFDEVTRYMRSHGFEILRVDVANWRYKTRHQQQFFDGRAILADTTFVRAPEFILAEGQKAQERFLRQILILTMIGRASYAEYLLEHYLADAPAALRAEVSALITANAAQDTWFVARWLGLPELHFFYKALRSRVGRLLRDKSGFKFKHTGF